MFFPINLQFKKGKENKKIAIFLVTARWHLNFYFCSCITSYEADNVCYTKSTSLKQLHLFLSRTSHWWEEENYIIVASDVSIVSSV